MEQNSVCKGQQNLLSPIHKNILTSNILMYAVMSPYIMLCIKSHSENTGEKSTGIRSRSLRQYQEAHLTERFSAFPVPLSTIL